jgi:hypothetical protein
MKPRNLRHVENRKSYSFVVFMKRYSKQTRLTTVPFLDLSTITECIEDLVACNLRLGLQNMYLYISAIDNVSSYQSAAATTATAGGIPLNSEIVPQNKLRSLPVTSCPIP